MGTVQSHLLGQHGNPGGVGLDVEQALQILEWWFLLLAFMPALLRIATASVPNRSFCRRSIVAATIFLFALLS
jgi:hypothetical protein